MSATKIIDAGRGLLRGRDLRHRLGQGTGRRRDSVQPSAIIPQDFLALFGSERQPEELLPRLREGSVRMRVVARHDEIFRPQVIDRVHRRLLVDIERDVALPPEVLAWQHRQRAFATRAELLPLVVKPPQPPRQPAGSAFEKGGAQLRMRSMTPPLVRLAIAPISSTGLRIACA